MLPRARIAILEHLAQGKSDREIAQALGYAESTVSAYLKTMYLEIGVAGRVALALWWVDFKQLFTGRHDETEAVRQGYADAGAAPAGAEEAR